jgi:ribosomal protein S18 acetylase RimI-like enzyme
MTIGIRSAREDENASIDALAVEAWQILEPGYQPSEWEGMLLAIGRMSQLRATGHLLVAADDKELHGAVVYVPPGKSNPKMFPDGWPTMRMLVVRPASRGRGIGKRLSDACIELAQRDGAPCIGLHTSPIMKVALPMYIRRGFVKDAELAPIAGAPYERYVLRFD